MCDKLHRVSGHHGAPRCVVTVELFPGQVVGNVENKHRNHNPGSTVEINSGKNYFCVIISHTTSVAIMCHQG